MSGESQSWMDTLLRLRIVLPLALLTLLAVACSSGDDPVDEIVSTSTPLASSDGGQTIVIPNAGNGQMEGHTPRGFRGSGTGLFAGDNLNSSFPNGDGVQIFLTFDISNVPPGPVTSATLRSDNFTARGTPFDDLGMLSAIEMRGSQFSPGLWDAKPAQGASTCVFATTASGPFACDLSGALQNSLDDGYGYAQFRLRFDRVSDSDGSADLAAFFLSNSNTNESGIFELTVEMDAAG